MKKVREINEMRQENSSQNKEVSLKISAVKTEVVQSSGMPRTNLRVDGVDRVYS